MSLTPILDDQQNPSQSSSSQSIFLNNDGSETQDQQKEVNVELPVVRVGEAHRLGFLALAPALISFILSTGLATALIVWLLSRRIFDHPANEDAFFKMAIVTIEGSSLPQTGLDGSRTVKSTLYGLLISSTAVSSHSFHSPSITNYFIHHRVVLLHYLFRSSWLSSPILPQLTGCVLTLPHQTDIINYLRRFNTVCY
jgi:hypothetical protein